MEVWPDVPVSTRVTLVPQGIFQDKRERSEERTTTQTQFPPRSVWQEIHFNYSLGIKMYCSRFAGDAIFN